MGHVTLALKAHLIADNGAVAGDFRQGQGNVQINLGLLPSNYRSLTRRLVGSFQSCHVHSKTEFLTNRCRNSIKSANRKAQNVSHVRDSHGAHFHRRQETVLIGWKGARV
jgi:hypothetical protein